MTNNEIRRNDETRMTKTGTARLRAIRHSCFGFLLSFGFRNWSFPGRFHLELARQERPLVSRFLNQLGGRFARAVVGPRLDPNQDGSLAGLRGLERRGIFETVRQHHAVVVVGRCDERGGVFYRGRDILYRRIRLNWFVILRVVPNVVTRSTSPCQG